MILQISLRWETLNDLSPDKYLIFSKPFVIYIWTNRGKFSVLLSGSPPSLKQLYQDHGGWAIVLKRLKLMIVKLRIWPACSASRQLSCSWLSSFCGKRKCSEEEISGGKVSKTAAYQEAIKPQQASSASNLKWTCLSLGST